MKIAIVGKFGRLHDEEYIARSFEQLGHDVCRIEERATHQEMIKKAEAYNPDLVLWTKLMVPNARTFREHCRKWKTVCWVFDLYFGYEREYRVASHPAFSADYVFTTDGGHDKEFEALGINHHTVRQGIFRDECVLLDSLYTQDRIAFVGSENQLYPERAREMSFIESRFGNKFEWYGKRDTNEMRGMKLNMLYADVKIVVGDSVYSPHYWSNRVVETLGRGGFLIHQEVEGISEEYPDLVTYPREDWEQLEWLITHYLGNEQERKEIVVRNFEHVQSKYTMDKKCQELLNWL